MIRKATENDPITLDQLARKVADNLHRIGIDQWSGVYPNQANFQSDLQKGGLFVYVKGDHIVASISILEALDEVYLSIPWKKSHSAAIHRLMVDPNHMHEGIGTELMRFAIDHIKASGYESIKVDTHPDNFRMKSLLIRFGFVPSGYLVPINRDAFELVFEE